MTTTTTTATTSEVRQGDSGVPTMEEEEEEEVMVEVLVVVFLPLLSQATKSSTLAPVLLLLLLTHTATPRQSCPRTSSLSPPSPIRSHLYTLSSHLQCHTGSLSISLCALIFPPSHSSSPHNFFHCKYPSYTPMSYSVPQIVTHLLTRLLPRTEILQLHISKLMYFARVRINVCVCHLLVAATTLQTNRNGYNTKLK